MILFIQNFGAALHGSNQNKGCPERLRLCNTLQSPVSVPCPTEYKDPKHPRPLVSVTPPPPLKVMGYWAGRVGALLKKLSESKEYLNESHLGGWRILFIN